MTITINDKVDEIFNHLIEDANVGSYSSGFNCDSSQFYKCWTFQADGRRNRLGGKKLEKDFFLKINVLYFEYGL